MQRTWPPYAGITIIVIGPYSNCIIISLLPVEPKTSVGTLIKYQGFSARLQYFQWVSNGDTAVLHKAIDLVHLFYYSLMKFQTTKIYICVEKLVDVTSFVISTSHYQSQCWPRSMLPYDVTGPQWVNHKFTWISQHQLWSSWISYFLSWLPETALVLVELMSREETISSWSIIWAFRPNVWSSSLSSHHVTAPAGNKTNFYQCLA